MSKIFSTSALLAALISTVAGHTAVELWEVGGEKYEGFYQPSLQDPGNQSPAWWTAQGTGWDPVMGSSINDPDIIAHFDAQPSPYTAKAPAGSDVTMTWSHRGSCEAGDEVGWDCSHHGWSAAYLAPCEGDCKDVDKTTLKFFKIEQAALLQVSGQEDVGKWGTDEIFYQNGNTQTITIPEGIPSGNYVLRAEVMSIHNNGDVSERQFWPQAFNIEVTGGDDSADMPEGKLGTELYNAEKNELLTMDLYWHPEVEAAIPDIPGDVKLFSSKKARRNHPRDFSA